MLQSLKLSVKITLLPNYTNPTPPKYATIGSSGFDLHAAISESIMVRPQQVVLIPTGIQLEIPNNFEGQVRPRSGLALKHGITVLNTPGTIDADYRGEIQVILINLSSNDFEVTKDMRIAQMVISPIQQVDFKVTTKLSDTTRGEKGFGSSGV